MGAKVEGLSRWLTQPRLDEYLIAANQDLEAARGLYEWNAAISAAFFELISYVEVSLRNAIDSVLRPLEVVSTARIGDPEGWWFASPSFLRPSELKYFEAALRHLGNGDTAFGRDKVLECMTLGAWTDIFAKPYEELFRHHLRHAFPHHDSGFTRKSVQTRVLALRKLRNRIAHHQAVFELPLEEYYEQADDLLRWMDPELRSWVGGVCRVSALLNQRPAEAESIAVVVPALEAWPFYQEHAAYICQPGRFFQRVSHVAFYAQGAIQPEVAKILKRIDPVDWRPDEIHRRLHLNTVQERQIAHIIKEARAKKNGLWSADEYQLFLLSRPGREGEEQGHVTLPAPVVQPRRGRGSAWVQRQRYVRLALLRQAQTVRDLEAE